jgi:hypothetical protein
MKLSNSQRDKRIIRILIPFGIVFSLLAAMSGQSEFLFGFVVVGSLSLVSRLLIKTQWYTNSTLKHRQGSLKFFPITQLLIIIPLIIVCVALGFGVVEVFENVL